MKTALVLGAGGFIGSHMVKRLKKDGYWVRGVDLKYPEYEKTEADEFIIGDLKDVSVVSEVMYQPNQPFDLVIQMAADMGGASYIFSGENDANVMHNSAMINLNVCKYAALYKVGKILFSSSACAYPQQIQETTDNKGLKESDCFPANPDSPYGWEKVFSEILYDAYARNYGLDIRICRFHNIFGECGTWKGGKEKAPAAVTRKVCEAKDGHEIEVWGDGEQTRSFLYIDEAVEGVMRLLKSNYTKPVNIGSDEMISINNLAKMAIEISGKNLTIKNVPSNAIGVRGRNSNNYLIKELLNWQPTQPLRTGMEKLYNWISEQINNK
jgi:nucleoside-diphosphate-sugar epimerase